MLMSFFFLQTLGNTGGGKSGVKVGECKGDGRREGGIWDSRGSRIPEKVGKLSQHCAIFCNSSGQEPLGKSGKRGHPYRPRGFCCFR